jgi:RNA polymerase sigma-70 factor (ECF subfamily)
MTGPSFSLQNVQDFDYLYSQTYLSIYRFIFGLYGGPTEEVEDMTAETYYRAWKSRSHFKGSEEAATAWLFKIARNLVIDAYRRRKNRPNSEMVPDNYYDTQLEDFRNNPENEAITSEQIQILLSILSSIPIEKRDLIVLRYILGWPVKRIANHYGLLENTVTVKIRRTLTLIRRNWPEAARD